METDKSDLKPLGRGRGRGIQSKMSVSSSENASVAELDNIHPQPQSLVLGRGKGRGRRVAEKFTFQDVSLAETDIQTGIFENFAASKSTPASVVEAPTDSSEVAEAKFSEEEAKGVTRAKGELTAIMPPVGELMKLELDSSNGEEALPQSVSSNDEERLSKSISSSNDEAGLPESKLSKEGNGLPDTDSLKEGEALSESDSSTEVEGEELPWSPPIPSELVPEFLADAVLSPEPLAKFMYCCICGVPAGKDAWICWSEGHSTCVECKTELKVLYCHYIHDDLDEPEYCRASLHNDSSSVFRDFLFDTTKFGCINNENGCEYQGIWEDVKSHQKSCQFTISSTTNNTD